jgi:hypothetical protein
MMLELDKPKDEECGNCYYCTSYKYVTTINISTGFLSVTTKDVTKEAFYCKRYPENKYYKLSNDWCGEWKQRTE